MSHRTLGTVAVLAHEHPPRAAALFDAVAIARENNAPAYVVPSARGWDARLDGTLPEWCPRELVWVVSQFGAVAAL